MLFVRIPSVGVSQQTRQQHDDAENAGVQEEGKGSNGSDEKQAVRFMAIGQVVYLSPAVSAVKARLKSGTVIKVLAVKSKEVKRENPEQISAGNSSGSSGPNNAVAGVEATAEGEERSPVVADCAHPPLAAPQSNQTCASMTTPPGSSTPEISGSPAADLDSALISAPASAPAPVSTALVSAYVLASAYAFISASAFACASALVSASVAVEPSPFPAPATGTTSMGTPTTGSGTTDIGTSSSSSSSDQTSSGGGSSSGTGAPPHAEHARIPLHHVEHVPLARPHMVHYVDVHLPWSHSLCACCLPRMLRPAPPVAFQISSLSSLRKHLQQPVPPSMPPFRLPNKPSPSILAYSATVSLSAPPLRPAGRAGAAVPAAAASAAPELSPTPSLAQHYRWKVDAAPIVAAEAMMLEWLAEPRVGLLLDLQHIRRQLAYILGIDSLAAARAAARTRGTGEAASRQELWWCCWQCSHCWTRYRRAVSIAAFIVLVAKFPRFVTLWRAHIRSATVAFPNVAFQFGAGRQAQGDCLASLLLQFALKCATLFCQPLFANCAALVFSDSAGSRIKERVEDAAVEEALNRLAAGEKGTQGSGVQDRGKRAIESDLPRASSAAAAGSTGANKGSSTASSARLVPVNSNAVVGLFTYRVTCLLRWVRLYGFRVNSSEHCLCSDRKKPAIALPHPIHDLPNLLQRFGAAPKPPATTGSESSAATGWKEFPEGDRATVTERERDTGEFMGIKILHVGPFQGGEVDREEVKKEHNVRELNLPPLGAPPTVNRNPGGGYTLQDNTSGPYFATLSHRVEEFLRRFAPARLAREGRNGPLGRAITSWAGRLGLGDRAWAALALGPFAPVRLKPILRSRVQVDILIEMIAGNILPAPVCTRCDRCIGKYYMAVNLTSLVAAFAYRPSSALLRCLLSLFPPRSARFKSFLETLGVAPVPVVVPDSLVAPLLEGVMEEQRLPLIYYGTQHILKEEGLEAILELVEQDRAAARKEALYAMIIAAGDPGATGAIGGMGTGEGRRGKAVASYLEPWPGGVNPLACLREMLLGETSYCPQAKYIAHDEDGQAENVAADTDVDSDDLEEILSSSDSESDSDNSGDDESDDADDDRNDATARKKVGRKRRRGKSASKKGPSYNMEWSEEELVELAAACWYTRDDIKACKGKQGSQYWKRLRKHMKKANPDWDRESGAMQHAWKRIMADYRKYARADTGSGNKATKKPKWWGYVQNLKHGTAAVRPHVVDGGGAGETNVDPNAHIPGPQAYDAGPSAASPSQPRQPTPVPLADGSGAGTPGRTPRRRVDETATMGGARLISDTIVACTKEGLQQLNQMAQYVVAAMTLAAHVVPPPANAAPPGTAPANTQPPESGVTGEATRTARTLFTAPEQPNDTQQGPPTQPQ
ncbi:unnamed protein product [Closterium sp. Yama58-4]|nr:unnamed protein product [Closterium sp. Yama58-4]